MINYIIQVVLFQVLFVAVYDFFLSKETFFSKNRWYLLSTSIVSFLLPFVKIPTIQKAVPVEYTIMLPEVVLSPQRVIEKAAWYQSIDYLDVLFWSGCLVFLIVFVVKLFRIVRLIFKYEIERKKTYKLVLLPKNAKAFSFFNYIFLGKEIPLDKQEKIIQHELVHSKQKHSIDLLFFEFLRILMWFNPMVYVYQNRISLVHEYISDEKVSKATLKENYINNLLSDVFQVENISFLNQFYKHSLIKKRIIMMTKKESKQIKQLKYLLLIPVLASMLAYTSCSQNANANTPEQKKENTVLYTDIKDMKKRVSKTKQSYMDVYLGLEPPKTKELQLNDLTSEELTEFNNKKEKLSKSGKEEIPLRLFEGVENKKRKTIFFDLEEAAKRMDNKEQVEKTNNNLSQEVNNLGKQSINNLPQETNYVPFTLLDKYPTFPGCREGDKDCLSRSMAKFMVENFDMIKVKGMGVKKGETKMYLQFTINKKGNIDKINVRAPHPDLKQYAIEVAEKLPRMKPGEKNNKAVSTGYTLPIKFNIY